MSIDSGIAQAQSDNLVTQNQVGESENIVRKVERVSKRSLWGYRGDEWVPFLKLTISTATNLPKVRDEYLLSAEHITRSLTSLLRIFERGECMFEGFKDITATYESNMPFLLRFMIDTKVSSVLL